MSRVHCLLACDGIELSIGLLKFNFIAQSIAEVCRKIIARILAREQAWGKQFHFCSSIRLYLSILIYSDCNACLQSNQIKLSIWDRLDWQRSSWADKYQLFYLLWSAVIDSVVFSFSCVSIGDVHASAVPALTAANDTEKKKHFKTYSQERHHRHLEVSTNCLFIHRFDDSHEQREFEVKVVWIANTNAKFELMNLATFFQTERAKSGWN